MTAACSSKRGIEMCRISATMDFPTANAKFAGVSLGCERRYATAKIVSCDASEDIKFRFIFGRSGVSSTDSDFSNFWKLVLHLVNFPSSLG